MNINIIIITFIMVVMNVYIYFLIEYEFNNITTSLENDGYILVENIKNKEELLKFLPKDYVFLNYFYEIKGCTLSTFHRDVTSSQYEFKTKHPIYTALTYFNDGNLLSVCPSSHKTVPYLYTNPITINGKNGNFILFNCDLVHAGAINDFYEKRHAIQYKIAHIEDLNKLQHLNEIHKIESGDCKKKSKSYELFCRHMSLLFCHFINHKMTKYLQDNDNTFISNLLIWIYGGKPFYNK
jgi:hypothetical protein